MKRKLKNSKEFEKERLHEERQNEINKIKETVMFVNEPTYYFNIGDKVQYGNLKESIVKEVLCDGKFYGLLCVATDNNYGNPYDYETYRVVMWNEIRPLTIGDTEFKNNIDVKFYFNNSTIESLIHKYYYFGIFMNPEYQRDFVWDDNNKEELLDSIFNNIDIGKFVLIRLSSEKWKETGFLYEILDGKQRLKTLIDFYENRILYKEKYYNDLSQSDRNFFKQHTISIGEVDDIDRDNVLKYFIMLNRCGRVMDKEQIKKVENMLNN